MRSLLLLILLLKALFGFGFVDDQPKIVPVDKAYIPSVKVAKDKVIVKIKMDPDVYLYKKYLKLKELSPNTKEIDLNPYLPKPVKLHDQEVYEKSLAISLPTTLFDPGRIRIAISYQGCNKIGVCYPPQTKTFEIVIPQYETKSTSKESQEQSIASTLKTKSLGIILVTFFGFGLLLALTPCIFPMIPILSSLIVGAKEMNTKKALLYSIVYVLAMAVTYTIAGVLAGLFGANLQAALQHPVIIVLFAAIFIALALSMFGFYEIGLPASLQTRLAKKSDEASHRGGLIGVAIMGFLSALIVGPCVAPPLAGALIYIGQTGDALLGGLALFVMSLGMGMPLLLVGIGAGRFMPKPGGWMEAVSRVFGVVMLGVAIWMLSRILPDWITMLLWATLFISSAVYLRALEGVPKGAFWFEYFKKSLGLILFIYGVLVMIGAFLGASNPLDPLKPLSRPAITQKNSLFEPVQSYEQFMQIVRTSKKPVVLDITAKWCASCKELEENTFSDPRVQKKLSEFRAIRLDVTDNTPRQREFLKRFGLFGPPAILFFKNGKELRSLRIVGYKSPDEFLKILEEAQQ